MEPFARRREQLARQLHDEGLDAFLITSTVNVTYLTGFTGDSSHLVLTRDRALLVSDPRYTGQIADECPGLPTHIRPTAQKLPEAVAEVLKLLGCRSAGFESGALSVAEYDALRGLAPTVDWKPGTDRVERARLGKDQTELAQVREARAMAAIRPGVEARTVDAAARSVIAEAGYGEHFGHGLGHGIGLEVHEGPAVRPNSDAVLRPGMVFTVERGVYLPGWGGVRIED